MSRTYLLGAISSVLVSVMSWTSHADAQATRSHDVEIIVGHGRFSDAPSDFHLSVYQSGRTDAGGTIDDGRLISPDGTEFDASSRSIRRNSLAEIAGTLIGNWTAYETLDGVESSYQFNVSPTTLDGVPLALPTITSPTDGATVGETFEVHWSFDNGGLPSGPIFQYFTNPDLIVVGVTAVLGTLNAIRFETNLLAPGPQTFDQLEVALTKSLPAPSLIGNSPELVGDQFRFDAHFEAISSPVTFNVVPEPGTLALAWISFLAFGRIRAFRSQARKGSRSRFHRASGATDTARADRRIAPSVQAVHPADHAGCHWLGQCALRITERRATPNQACTSLCPTVPSAPNPPNPPLSPTWFPPRRVVQFLYEHRNRRHEWLQDYLFRTAPRPAGEHTCPRSRRRKRRRAMRR